MAKLALVTHVVAQIKVTLHGSRKATETELEQQILRPLYAPDSDVTVARGSDVKATPSPEAKALPSRPLPETGTRLPRPSQRKRGPLHLEAGSVKPRPLGWDVA